MFNTAHSSGDRSGAVSDRDVFEKVQVPCRYALGSVDDAWHRERGCRHRCIDMFEAQVEQWGDRALDEGGCVSDAKMLLLSCGYGRVGVCAIGTDPVVK